MLALLFICSGSAYSEVQDDTETEAVSAQNDPEAEAKKIEFMKSVVMKINASYQEVEREKIEASNAGNKGAIFPKISRPIPFGDWDFYYLEDDLVWKPNLGSGLTHTITVPKGFVTDLASVPRLLWFKYSPQGRYAYAAIVHDYLYWVQDPNISKEEADKILKAAMIDSGVPELTVKAFNLAVDKFGGSSWKKNTEAKKHGEKRILKIFPNDPLISWKDYKKNGIVFSD